MLLHGCEAHGVVLSEPRDRMLVGGRSPHDVTPRAVGEGCEEDIDLEFAQLIYNHEVVR